MELAAGLVLKALPACALLALIGGLAWRLAALLRAPVALPLDLPPAPRGRLALARRLAWRALTLGGLRRRRPLVWALSLLFHLSLLALILGHLELWAAPAPTALIWLGKLRLPAAWCLAAGLLILTARRLADPVLYLLTGRAGFALAGLMGALVVSGLGLGLLVRPDPLTIKSAALAMTGAAPLIWPGWGLALHLLLASALVALIPFTRLSHGLLLFLSPVACRRATDPAHPRLGPLEPRYAGEQPPEEAVLPGEPPLATVEDYRVRLARRWSGQGARRVLGAAARNRSARDGEGTP